jgi:hypothetical protein
VLFVSGIFFSWLAESRNYVPVAIVMAVAAARYLTASLEAQARSAKA